MTTHRRTFTALLAILPLAAPAVAAAPADAPATGRIALFRNAGFPTVDAPAIDDATLTAALQGFMVDTLSASQLAERLDRRHYDLLLLPYGSAFPLNAWPAILGFLRHGGDLAVLGGAPFHQPVRWQRGNAPGAGRFVEAPRTPAFAHELLIGPAEIAGWPGTDPATLHATSVDGSEWSKPFPLPKTTYALTVRLGTRPSIPDQGGSEAPRDAVLRPLVHVVNADGLPLACPLLEIDRLRGAEAGGRWVLAPSDAPLGAELIHAIVARALEGAVELEARPIPASVDPGSIPRLRIWQRRPQATDREAVPMRAHVVVRNDAGRVVFEGDARLAGVPQARIGEVAIRPPKPLPPGLYHAVVSSPDAPWEPRSTRTGFWVLDAALLGSAPDLTVSRDWIRRGGKVFPVIGTTYMASDVDRMFLFEPNPAVWDRDFAAMAKQGVNFVRTGLWTAWSRAMLNPGAVDEDVLRALDAYVQTAARHDIVVCFNFFAFLPPSFGGTNPYLDPRALEGQRAFLTAVAARYRGVHWIHYDLINEPSYAPPEGLWSTRAIGDAYEGQAWADWVKAHHGDDPARLRALWQEPDADPLKRPGAHDLDYAMIRDRRTPRKGRDFIAFTQDTVAHWAATLRAALRAAGGDVLVTLGQDEGGTGTRPAQQLHAGSVDYTCVHPWWQNDDVLATGVLTKVPEKPNLFQETGLMRLEDVDGFPWRSPEAAFHMLERKYADAFASRGAGAVEWAWNINPYMPIDNESVIGLIRPDGTAKPETAVLSEFARFFSEAAPYLDDFEPDPVVVVIPHARLFLGRPAAMNGVKRVIRVLAERYGVVPTALSDLRLTPERLATARLVLVPTPEVIDQDAAEALLAASRAGTKVLVTGPVLGDSYGGESGALEDLHLIDPGRPVVRLEPTHWSPAGWAAFEHGSAEWLRRALAPSLTALTGSVWHEPLPLEYASSEEPIAALLGAALKGAGIETQPSDTHVATRLLWTHKAVLVACINETASDATRHLNIEGHPLDVHVSAGRVRLVLLERATGRALANSASDAQASSKPARR